MNVLNLMYFLLMTYFILFINEIIKLYRISSFKTLFKSSYIKEKSFVVSIFSIIFKSFITPAIGFISIYLTFKKLQISILHLFQYSKYYYDTDAVNWIRVIFNGDMSSFKITNLDLLSKINSELFYFKVMTLILVISTLAAQFKLFDKRNLGIFEEGLMCNGCFYDWSKVISIYEICDNYNDNITDKVSIEILVAESKLLKSIFMKIDKIHNRSSLEIANHLQSHLKEPEEYIRTIKINISKHNYIEFSYVVRHLGYRIINKHVS